MSALKCIAIVILILISSLAQASEIPTPKDGETFSWSFGVQSNNEGHEMEIGGPEVISERILSREELLDLCYRNNSDTKQLEDCLSTFIEPPNSSPVSRKIDTDSLSYLTNSCKSSCEAYLNLTNLENDNPIDILVKDIYLNNELYEYGVYSLKDSREAIMANVLAERRVRYSAIRETFEEIPDLEIINHLEGLDWLHVKLSITSLLMLEAMSDVESISVTDPYITMEPQSQESPIVLEHLQMHDPYFVSDTGLYTGYYDGFGVAPTYDRITVGIIDTQGFNASHLVFKSSTSSSSYRIAKSYECESACVQYADPLDIEADQNTAGDPACDPADLFSCDCTA